MLVTISSKVIDRALLQWDILCHRFYKTKFISSFQKSTDLKTFYETKTFIGLQLSLTVVPTYSCHAMKKGFFLSFAPYRDPQKKKRISPLRSSKKHKKRSPREIQRCISVFRNKKIIWLKLGIVLLEIYLEQKVFSFEVAPIIHWKNRKQCQNLLEFTWISSLHSNLNSAKVFIKWATPLMCKSLKSSKCKTHQNAYKGAHNCIQRLQICLKRCLLLQ